MFTTLDYKCLIKNVLYFSNFLSFSRKSSPALAQAVLDGIAAVGGTAKDYGVVSTPLLHYFVVCQNTNGAYGEATEKGYCEKLSKAFKKIRGDVSLKCINLYYRYIQKAQVGSNESRNLCE